MNLIEALILPENLSWAWSKVKNFYRALDGWSGELEVSTFEVNLSRNLKAIREDFQRGNYSTRPLLPIPQPKRKDEEGKSRTRQMFWPSVRDQVAWIAYVNVIGPKLDRQMPPWSYGNRLYRSVWFEEDGDRQKLRIGRYRNTAGQVYRTFRQSWPVYRRHIHLTVKRMAGAEDRELSQSEPAEARVFEVESKDLEDSQKLPYLNKEFWEGSRITHPCWAGLDFEKFYPRLDVNVIKSVIRSEFHDDHELIGRLLDGLLEFSVEPAGLSEEELKTIDLGPSKASFGKLPTGLMAAGFLANVALLKVDKAVEKRVKARRVAHFRYVDDHVVLAADFTSLTEWIKDYKTILAEHCPGAKFNEGKSEPKALGEYLKAQDAEAPDQDLPVLNNKQRHDLRFRAERECTLDHRFPAPLMTQTLAKISEIGRVDLELLDAQEQQILLNDLEHLMLAEFPPAELRPETRVAFAAGKLTALASQSQQPLGDLVVAYRLIAVKEAERSEIEREAGANPFPKQAENIARLKDEISNHKLRYFRLLRRYRAAERKNNKRTGQLLLKGVAEYPEKFRLWQHALKYCERAGQINVQDLEQEIKKLREANELASRFTKASILQVLAHQAIDCSKQICAPDVLPTIRRSALLHLRTILAIALSDELQPTAAWYSKPARQAFLAAFGLAVAYLEQNGPLAGVKPLWIEGIAQAAKQAGAWDWTSNIAEEAKRTSYSLATWVWWAEPLVQPLLATEPGIPWNVCAPLLPRKGDDSISVKQLYSHGAQKARLAAPNGRNTALATPRRGPSSRNKVNLLEWSAWLKQSLENEPFDPRAGEWTALEITRQVAALSRQMSPEMIKPQNFYIPEDWKAYPSDLTWEKWRSIAQDETVTRAVARRAKSARSTLTKMPEVEEFNRVCAVATILLGLARKDFLFPASWQLETPRPNHAVLTRTLIALVPCSSWTNAILKGCLLPRQRETVLWPLLFPAETERDDTADDPPSFGSLDALQDGIRVAQKILISYQLSVRDNKARQMIPIRLTQLTNDLWRKEGSDEVSDPTD